MDRLTQDVRLALRSLRRSPAFTATAVLILGLGIGMAVAMVATCRTILLRRLPVADQGHLAVLWTYQVPTVEFSVTAADLPAILRASRTLRTLAGVAHWGTIDAPLAERDRTIVLRTSRVTANYFDVLGARPVAGRFFKPEDADSGADEVMVLSYGAWRAEFGGSPTAIGLDVTDPSTNRTATIIGIAPAGLDYPSGVQAWSPLEREALTQVFAVARLAPGMHMEAARQEFFRIAHGMQPAFKLTGAKAETFAMAIVGNARPILVALLAAVALLLTIACVNIGTLFLVRASSREHELAVRRALGATGRDLVRQLLIEGLAVAVTAGALGLVSGRAILAGLVTLAPPDIPRLDDVRLHGSLLGAAAGVTAAAVLVFGVLPALGAARFAVPTSIQLGQRTSSTTRQHRGLRQWLVTFQVALALVMLTGAGLLARSLLSLEQLSLGYRTQHLSIGRVAFDWYAYDAVDKVTRLSEEVMRSVRTIPGVASATTLIVPPFVGPNVLRAPFEAEGALQSDSEATPNWPYELAGSEYFQTFGIPIIRGRGLLDSDRRDAPPVAVVSQSVARRFWPGQDAIGKRIRFSPAGCGKSCTVRDTSFEWRTVVGVVPDTRFRALRQTSPTVYLPEWQMWFGWGQAGQAMLAIRSTESVATLTPAVRASLRHVDPTLAVYDLESMDEVLGGPLAEPRLVALLVSAFGVVALVLAAVGLYGAIASLVREQTREIGIRLALGAAPGHVRDAVLGRALKITAVGVLAGAAAAAGATRVLQSLLYGVSPADPATLAATCIFLLLVALIAGYLPARRATRIDPVRSLRTE